MHLEEEEEAWVVTTRIAERRCDAAASINWLVAGVRK